MAASPWPWELILVDDGSADRTVERIREAAAASPGRVSGVILRRRFGQTAAMQAGIDRARGSVIATMDGDLQNNPATSCAGGPPARRRPRPAGRLAPRAQRQFLAAPAAVLAGQPPDRGRHRRRAARLGCSLKIYRAAVLREVRLYGEMHRFIPTWMATVTSPARIREEEVSHFARVHGKSKYGAVA